MSVRDKVTTGSHATACFDQEQRTHTNRDSHSTLFLSLPVSRFPTFSQLISCHDLLVSGLGPQELTFGEVPSECRG